MLEHYALFQFSPLREGRQVGVIDDAGYLIFQFSPLREGRLPFRAACFLLDLFQFSPLREGRRRILRNKPCIVRQFQFSPLREGRLLHHCRMLLAKLLFQFSPLREGRLDSPYNNVRDPDFNSRPCERGDKRGAEIRKSRYYFNSRPCERGDAVIAGEGEGSARFQFSPLREGRPLKRNLMPSF